VNGNDGNVGMGTGGISILAIFVVLCLTTLATLSLVSAKADKALAEMTVQASEEYYAADARAEELLGELVLIAQSGVGWEQKADEAGYAVDVNGREALVSYSVAVSENKTLEAVVSFELDDKGVPTGGWDRKSWRTHVESGYGEEKPLPVFTAN